MELLILLGAMLVAFGLAAVIKRIAARAAAGSEDRSEVSPDKLVTFTTFRDLTDAELLRGRLESAGIKCVLFGDTIAKYDPKLTMDDEIQLKVRAGDVKRAVEYLS